MTALPETMRPSLDGRPYAFGVVYDATLDPGIEGSAPGRRELKVVTTDLVGARTFIRSSLHISVGASLGITPAPRGSYWVIAITPTMAPLRAIFAADWTTHPVLEGPYDLDHPPARD